MSIAPIANQKSVSLLTQGVALPTAASSQAAPVQKPSVSSISPSVVVKISSAALAPSALNPATLTAANIGSYSASELMGLSSTQIGKISGAAIGGLNNTQLGSLSKAFFSSLSAIQVRALSAMQIQAVGSSNIDALNAAIRVNTSTDRAFALIALGQSGISIADTSSNFTNNLSQIASNSGKINAIRFSNASPTLALTYNQYSTIAGLAAKLPVSGYSMAVSGVSVANLASLAQNAKVRSINVVDLAANISSNIASTTSVGALKTYLAKLASITANDATRQTITVNQSNTSTQYSTYQGVLAKLTGATLKLNLTGSLVNNQANTDQLNNFQSTANADGTFNIQQWSGSAWKTLLANTKGVNLLQASNATVYLDSGSAQVNAVLNSGLTNNWQSGSAATPSASVSGSQIAGNLYSLKSSDSSSTTHLNISYLPSMKSEVLNALDYISSVANISFTDVTGTSTTPDIVYGENVQSNSAGYATGGNSLNRSLHASQNNGVATNNVNSVYVELASNQATNSTFTPGSYGWQTIIHETGHVLGLKHPGNYNAGGGSTPGPYLPSGDAGSNMWSVMSYNNPSDAFNWSVPTNSIFYSGKNLNPSTYMPLDIAALQFLYGANNSGVSKNSWDSQSSAPTVDNFQTTTFNSSWQSFETIDTAHSSTLNLSAVSNSNIVDLRAGNFSSINILPSNTNSSFYSGSKIAQTYFGLNNVALAYGSAISNVIGGSGNDTYFAGSNNEIINDASGNNILELAGSAANWTSTATQINGTSYQAFTNNQTHQEIDVNIANLTLKYYDSSVAATHTRLDLVA